MEYEYVVGVDPSLTATAICRLSPDSLETPYTLVVTSLPAKGLISRLDRYKTIVDRLLVDMDLAKSLVLIEGYSYGSQGRGILNLAEFGGILRMRLWLKHLAGFVEVAPTTLKKFLLGKGGGKGTDKDAIAVALYKRWGIEMKTADERDAYVLARIGAVLTGWAEPENRAQREVADLVEGSLYDVD